MTRRCDACGELFTPAGRGRPPRFCCSRCRYRWNRRRALLRARVDRFDRLAECNAGRYRELYERRADEARTELAALHDGPA